MRFFYVPRLKNYITYPASITFLVSFILQFIPLLFLQEITFLAHVKTQLGYPITYFANNTLLALRFFLSLLYGMIAGLIGLLYFRVKYRKSGHTILVSKGFQRISGIGYLIIMFALLHSEAFAINPIRLPRISSPFSFSPQISTKLRAYFTPSLQLAPASPQTIHPQSGLPAANPAQNNSNPISNQQANSGMDNQNTQYQPIYRQQQNYNPPQQMQQPQPTTPRMATPQELFSALNVYRQKKGVAPLQWDTKLGNYAQQRANLYASLKDTDNHAGFNSYVDGNGHYELCFYGLGENATYGTAGDGTYIIEQWFGNSPAHDSNQLNSEWTHVGFGVSGTGVDVIFGGEKITAADEHAPANCK